MNNAIALSLTILRNKETDRITFRKTSNALFHLLAQQALESCNTHQVSVETPLGTAAGLEMKNRIILLPILRSGLTMLPAFLAHFPDAPIGIVGYKRDEKTALPNHYYTNIPLLHNSDQIIILDPMIATGGTALATLTLLEQKGVAAERIIFVALLGSSEGIATLKKQFPNITLIVGAQDPALNDKKFIVPGLGDFGDRFFGTEV